MSEIVIEEMKDKNYEDNILVKVLLYYVKNIDDVVFRLHLHHWEYLVLKYSTDWFKFDGDVYSLKVVHVEKSDLKTMYVYKLEGEESYCLGSIALICKEDETPDHKYTIKIEDIDFQ